MTLASLVAGVSGPMLALPAQAQASGAPGRPVTSATMDASRADLTRRLDSLQRVPSSKGNKAEQKDRADEIARLKARLTVGDLQVGDRFVVDDGSRRDTVLVRDGQMVALSNWPDYSVKGALFSELQREMEKYAGTYLREPRIRVYELTRLSFTGGFGRPGTLTVDPSRPLADAINAAGSTPKLDKITIYRANKKIYDEKRVASAVQNGETAMELGLLPGDEVRAPEQKKQGFHMPTYQVVLFGIAAVSSILTLIRSSYVP